MKIKLEDIQQYKLKKWLQAEKIRDKLVDAAEVGNVDEICNLIYSYTDFIEVLDRNSNWYEVASLFSAILSKNVPKIIPILLGSSDKKTEIPWDYDDHAWYSWAHTFSKEKGWTLEYIAELDINDAVALMQEIETEKQLEREWQWSLTEFAHPYNSITQKSEFQPLPRPDWMQISLTKRVFEPKKVKMPIDLLPVGNVIKYGNPETS